MIQRYDMAPYAMGWEKNDDGEVCMSRDVEELEAKYCKLTEAHDIALQALGYIARLYDDSKPLYQVAYDAYAMKSEAAMALEKINEVVP